MRRFSFKLVLIWSHPRSASRPGRRPDPPSSPCHPSRQRPSCRCSQRSAGEDSGAAPVPCVDLCRDVLGDDVINNGLLTAAHRPASQCRIMRRARVAYLLGARSKSRDDCSPLHVVTTVICHLQVRQSTRHVGCVVGSSSARYGSLFASPATRHNERAPPSPPIAAGWSIAAFVTLIRVVTTAATLSHKVGSRKPPRHAT